VSLEKITFSFNRRFYFYQIDPILSLQSRTLTGQIECSLTLAQLDQIAVAHQLAQPDLDGVAVGLADGLDIRNRGPAVFSDDFKDPDRQLRQLDHQLLALDLRRQIVLLLLHACQKKQQPNAQVVIAPVQSALCLS
jgi:hypothetical protein